MGKPAKKHVTSTISICEPAVWPAYTLFLQVLIDHRIWILNNKEGRYKPELHLSINPIICSMAVILRNFTIVVTAVVRTRPRTIPLAFFTMRKAIHGSL